MTLRTRIAAVASVSVALAVLARRSACTWRCALTCAGKSTARCGRARTRSPARRRSPAAFSSRYPARYGRPEGFPGSVEPAPFGGASGYVQFVSQQGQVYVPGGQGSSRTKIPLTAGDRAIAARGSGSSFSERSVGSTQLRVLTLGTGRGARS